MTPNVVRLEDAIPSFLVEVTARNKASEIVQILEQAKQRGHITTAEVARILPSRVIRDRDLFSSLVAQLGEYLKKSDLSLSSKSVVLELRVNKPSVKSPALIAKESADTSTLKRVPQTSFKSFDKEEGGVFNETSIESLDDTETLMFDEESIETSLSKTEEREFEDFRLNDVVDQYKNEAARYQRLTKEELHELSRRIREDDDTEARNKIVRHNLLLVISVARRFAWSKLPFADLVQEGNLGLMTAAEKYDPEQGAFSTYATWWIRQGIWRSIQNCSDVIRIPVSLQVHRSKILRVSEEIAMETGHIPGTVSIAARLGLSVDLVTNTLRAYGLFHPHSLNEVVGNQKNANRRGADDTSELQDLTIDQNAFDPALTIEAKEEFARAYLEMREILELVAQVVGSKNERNLFIFKERHGLNDDGEPKSLEEIGEMFDVTRERVRQILDNIYLKLSRRYGSKIDRRIINSLLFRIQELEKLVGDSLEW